MTTLVELFELSALLQKSKTVGHMAMHAHQISPINTASPVPGSSLLESALEKWVEFEEEIH